MPHVHEKITFTAEIFIVHKNKVLLRMHEKHNIWLSVGGKIESNENPIQAVIREAKEEVGLDVEIIGSKPSIEDEFDYKHLLTPRYLGCHYLNESHGRVVFVYFGRSLSSIIKESAKAHERTETRWVTKEELGTMGLRPNILFYATEALKELGEK